MAQRFCSNCGGEVSLPFCSQCGTATGLPRPEDRTPVHEDEAFATSVRMPPVSPLPVTPPPVAPPPVAPRAVTPPSVTSSPAFPAAVPPPPYSPPVPPLPAPPAPAQLPMGPPPPRPAHQPTAGNPFAGVTVRDWMADLGAAVLLLSSIALPWDLARGRVEEVNDHWWVVLSIVVSLFSLAVPYVGRTGIVPGLTPRASRLTKAAMAAPLALSLLALLALELVYVTDPAEGGLGTGAALAAAGALLAAQPRSFDETPVVVAHWRRARQILLVAGVVVLLGSLAVDCVRFITSDLVLGDSFFSIPAWAVVLVLLAAIVGVLIPFGLSFIAIGLNGHVVGGRVLGAAVGCFVFVSVFGRADRLSSGSDAFGGGIDQDDVPLFFGVSVEKLSHEPGLFGIPQGAGALLIVAAVAILARHPDPAGTPATRATEWVATARVVSLYAGVAAFAAIGLNIVSLLLAEINDSGLALSGQTIGALVVLGLAAAIALLIAMTLGGSDAPPLLPVALAGGWIVLGCVFTGLINGGSTETGFVTLFSVMTIVEVFLAFGAPILVLVALLVPASVRAHRGPLLATSPAVPSQPPPPAGPW